MNKTSLLLMLCMLAASATFATTCVYMDPTHPTRLPSAERIHFKIKGTGSKNIMVTIGIGYQVGSGACCFGVSPYTTASFDGNVGDVVYEGNTRRVITKIYRDLEGTTIDLAQYY